MELQAKRLGPDDGERLSRLWTQTFRDAYHDMHDAEDIDAYCRDHLSLTQACEVLSDARTQAFIASHNGEVVGYYVLKAHDTAHLPGQSSCELKQIYLRSAYYGGGIGRALFAHALETASLLDKAWLWLCVSDSNPRALAFYSKYGFVRLGTGPTFEVGKVRLASSVFGLKLEHD